jgi:arylmalonate decarboxylase
VSNVPLIGMIVPPAADRVPPEPLELYPDGVRFAAKGLGLGQLTVEGYDSVIDKTTDFCRAFKAEGASAVVMMGTSLSFYRGRAFNEQLTAAMREATGGLPVTTMSTAIVEALRAVGARRVAVATAYANDINQRLSYFLIEEGFDVASLEALGVVAVDDLWSITSDDLADLGHRAIASAQGADALLISCGGLRTLPVTVALESSYRIPVVSSAIAASWSAMRLIGHSGKVPGYGRLLELDLPVGN